MTGAPLSLPGPDHPGAGEPPVPGCWCCAFYGLRRPATRLRGLCLACAVLSGTCEHGHRMAARYEAGSDD